MFMANLYKRVEYGYTKMEKHLFSPQARRDSRSGGRLNPYDPLLLDDPDIKCHAYEYFEQAEEDFEDLEEGSREVPKLVGIDDYGSQIRGNKWFTDKLTTFSNKANASVIVVFQSWPSYGDFKNLVDCWVAFADCASYKTQSWKQMFCLGKYAQDHLGRALSVKQQQAKIDRWFETATCQPQRESYNFALVHTRNLLPDGSTPVFSNLTHFVSAKRVGQLKEIPDTFAPPPVLAGADGIQTMVQYERARVEGTLHVVPSASSTGVPVGVLVDDEEQDMDYNSNPSLAGVGSGGNYEQARRLREQHNTKDRLRLLIRKYIPAGYGCHDT